MKDLSLVLTIAYILFSIVFLLKNRILTKPFYGKFNNSVHFGGFIISFIYFYFIQYELEWYLYNIISLIITITASVASILFLKKQNLI